MSEKKTAKAKLGIEYVPTDKLIPYARNAKTHSPEQVAAIAGSIREFGFNNPVLIDPENGIIAGHGRVLAAQKLELAEIPCIRLGHLTEAQKRAYILADNKLAEYGAGWDNRMLALELDQLLADGFKPLDLGFDAGDMGKLSKDFLDLENPLGWNEDMIPVQDERKTEGTSADCGYYCAFKNDYCIDLATGPCPHACTYCFIRVSKAGKAQRGFKLISKKAITEIFEEAAKVGGKTVTLGNCNDGCLPVTKDLLEHALKLAAELRVFVEVQTKNPILLLDAVAKAGLPANLLSAKVSFSILNDVGGKYAEPGAPLVSARLAAMKEITEMGGDVIFRHSPLIVGYIPQNLPEMLTECGAKAYLYEPLRLAATTIAHNERLGRALDQHGNSIHKWCDAVMRKDDAGKFIFYGAMHYYSYRLDILDESLTTTKAMVESANVNMAACSGIYGLALEKYNTTGIPYGCWTKLKEAANLQYDRLSLHARVCECRMHELRLPYLKELNSTDRDAEIDRLAAANLDDWYPI